MGGRRSDRDLGGVRRAARRDEAVARRREGAGRAEGVVRLLAPPGAPAHWLPPEAWVYNHWLPYDEGRLYALLGVTRGDIWRQLRDDHHNLAELARAHGWPSPERLAAALVAPRAGEVSPATLRVLQGRALRTITQGHLAQHLFFHSLHQFAIPSEAPEIFGVTDAEFRALRRGEQSPLDVGRVHGRSPSQIQALAAAVLRERVRAGVSSGAMTAQQGRLLLARQLAQLPRWLAQVRYNGPPPTHDGKLVRLPRDYAANPAISGDGRHVVFEAYQQHLPLALARGEISVQDRTLVGDGAGRDLAGEPGAPRPAVDLQPVGLRDGAVRRVRVGRRQPQLRQALRPDPGVRARRQARRAPRGRASGRARLAVGVQPGDGRRRQRGRLPGGAPVGAQPGVGDALAVASHGVGQPPRAARAGRQRRHVRAEHLRRRQPGRVHDRGVEPWREGRSVGGVRPRPCARERRCS